MLLPLAGYLLAYLIVKLWVIVRCLLFLLALVIAIIFTLAVLMPERR